MIQFTTGVAFLLSSMYTTTGTQAAMVSAIVASTSPSTETSKVIVQDRKLVEKYLREQYADTPLLVEIARCESTFTQFDQKGNVIRGRVNSKDVGVMQINEKYHLDTAKALGIDLHTIEGNVKYAKHLYEKQGAAPWSASKPCWGKA